MSEGKTQRSAGWYVGACVFWLLAAWLITVGVSSLVPQIFAPQLSVASRSTSCAEDLHDLHEELLDRAAVHVKAARNEGTRDTLNLFFSDFDRRLMHIKQSCTEGEHAAVAELVHLRHGLEALLERFEREQAPHVRKLRTLLNKTTEEASTP